MRIVVVRILKPFTAVILLVGQQEGHLLVTILPQQLPKVYFWETSPTWKNGPLNKTWVCVFSSLGTRKTWKWCGTTYRGQPVDPSDAGYQTTDRHLAKQRRQKTAAVPFSQTIQTCFGIQLSAWQLTIIQQHKHLGTLSTYFSRINCHSSELSVMTNQPADLWTSTYSDHTVVSPNPQDIWQKIFFSLLSKTYLKASVDSH